MHAHCEIVIPAADESEIQERIAQVMKPFDENDEESYRAFWDWYQIGGRFAGEKLQKSVDPDKLEEFYAELKERKVTVSSLQCGKQSLQPEDQIPMVDQMWRDYFPGTVDVCPLFSHSNDQYKNETLPRDVCLLGAVPGGLRCHRLIVAGPKYDGEGIEAVFMLQDDFWNGVTHQDTDWGGCFRDGITRFREHLKGRPEQYIERVGITDGHMSVTVDYHS